jgi:hypothetical protein
MDSIGRQHANYSKKFVQTYELVWNCIEYEKNVFLI